MAVTASLLAGLSRIADLADGVIEAGIDLGRIEALAGFAGESDRDPILIGIYVHRGHLAVLLGGTSAPALLALTERLKR